MQYEIPAQWQQPLQAIAQSTGRTLEEVMEEAIALYLSRRTPLPPSMARGQSYEEIENEPDEVLWGFLQPSPPSPAKSPPDMNLEDEDEPYEILPGFLEP